MSSKPPFSLDAGNVEMFDGGDGGPTDSQTSHGPRAYRWGNQVHLFRRFQSSPSDLRRIVVDTPQFQIPVTWLLQLQFSASAECTVDVQILRSVDQLGGIVEEHFRGTISAPNAEFPSGMPSAPGTLRVPRILQSHKLIVRVELVDAGVDVELDVAASCSPVKSVDEAAMLQPQAIAGALGGFGSALAKSFVTSVVAATFLESDVARRQFWIANHSTANLAIGFGFAPSFGVGALYTFVLPGSATCPFASYESLIGSFTGEIFGVWDAADPTGLVMITTGRTP